MTVDLGDVYPLTFETRDANGQLANATLTTLTIGLPDGTSATPVVSNPSAGTYRVDYPTVQQGHHSVRWVATGTNAVALTDAFNVVPAAPANIISLSDAKNQCKIPETTTTHDDALRQFIAAAGYVIENHRKETILRRTVVEYHSFREQATRLVLRSTPVISLTSVATADGGTTWGVGTLNVVPDSGLVTGLHGLETVVFYGNVCVTYVAGRTVIPGNYLLAARIIVQHLWETQRGQTRTGTWPGAQEDSVAVFGMGYAIPNRALQLLGKPPPLVA